MPVRGPKFHVSRFTFKVIIREVIFAAERESIHAFRSEYRHPLCLAFVHFFLLFSV